MKDFLEQIEARFDSRRIGQKAWPDLDEETSVPDTIEICQSYSSSWGYGDDTEHAAMEWEEVSLPERKMEKPNVSELQEADLRECRKKELRNFGLEMMCCLTVLIVIGVGIRFMWRQYTAPSMVHS
ncbi:hypothetical protein IV203_009678 [Nitzschia inconspicua]|uniref:Uncharacterized protein n=1 Tax=Nitzschia inconspicua TaxID=303405 RepID=A0A9K3KUN7_9STRA|nr:hypothetical protein IV203_009678 [Nitzschia inconspicua]